MSKLTSQPVNLYGAGGHSQVVAATLRSQKIGISFRFDDNIELVNKSKGRFQPGFRLAPEGFLQSEGPFILAIGNNKVRSQLANELQVHYATAIHTNAIIDGGISIGLGSVVFAGAIIQPDSQLGEHVIINTSASIDHDCQIDDFAHVSPGATLCGNVVVEQGAHVGAGATIIQGVKIGRWSTVGAGAVVIRDVPDFATVVGCPAKQVT